ncbi:MAG: NADH-quinone oxidoreductase subunit N [Desulfobacterales bacterium]|nr:NADH-quinone oxidoreductase subunit N [Desulfobacterales bacterium]
MRYADYMALLPLMVLSAACAVVMLQIALWRRHGLTAGLTLAGLAATLAALTAAAPWTPIQVTALLTIDRYGLFFIALILLATGATVLLGYAYFRSWGGHREEFYLLLLIAALGACVLAVSRHFAAFFIGLEILSIALYALIAYPRKRAVSVEAGLKYLVLAAGSAGFLLFGMALIYAERGTLDFSALSAGALLVSGPEQSLVLLAGLALVMVGVGFKLALVPFHMWTADVYQGAPAPVTAFVATVSKSAVVALLVRLLVPAALDQASVFGQALGALAAASMIGGNFLALRQQSVKRILAYSSIAHLGYVLVAVLAAGPAFIPAVMFYMTAYTISQLGCFGVIAVRSTQETEADSLDAFRGLFFQHPWLAAVFTAMLLSLAGIPLTAGFVGKFYVITAGAQSHLWWLVLTLVLTSGIGLFYYLRIVVTLFNPAPAAQAAAPTAANPVAFSGAVVLTVTTLLLVWMGSVPEPLVRLLQQMTP